MIFSNSGKVRWLFLDSLSSSELTILQAPPYYVVEYNLGGSCEKLLVSLGNLLGGSMTQLSGSFIHVSRKTGHRLPACSKFDASLYFGS
jgi:hypothetical protein